MLALVTGVSIKSINMIEKEKFYSSLTTYFLISKLFNFKAIILDYTQNFV